ncbi:MAG: HTTM domain-containing protein [Candidatus Obscuribacterales bacterium]|nr:HTTM domain-containing protein [Candidatus Obscuribacterales bacterium]
MKFGSALSTAWQSFFFKPYSSLPISVFRILFGLLALEYANLLSEDILTWFGPNGTISFDCMQRMLGSSCLDLLCFLPRTDETVLVFFGIFVLSAIFVTLGLFTRLSTVVLYLTLSSLHYRNPIILNSGDDLLRVYSFFMLFAPAGDYLSIDALWKKRQKPGWQPEARSPWAQRLIQIEICLLYLQYTVTKLLDPYWLNGSAVYYVLISPELERFPLFFDRHSLLVSQILTWGTLVQEALLCTLIWSRKYKYYVLAAGLFFHFCLDYCLNIPIFQHVIVCSYILFVEPQDLQKFFDNCKSRFLLPKKKTRAD